MSRYSAINDIEAVARYAVAHHSQRTHTRRHTDLSVERQDLIPVEYIQEAHASQSMPAVD